MIEVLSGLSLFLGWVLHGAAQIFLVALAIYGIYTLVDKIPASSCNNDCNQGRNCNCVKK